MRDPTRPRTRVALAGLFRTALAVAMQYRASFLVESAAAFGGALAVFLPVIFVYRLAPGVAGWSQAEAMLVTAFFLVLQGLVGLVIEPNFSALVEGIRNGTFDFVLLKPVDAQLATSFQRLAPARGWDVLAGIGVGVWATASLPLAPSITACVAAAGMLAAGLVGMYGLYLLVVCSSFWFVRVDNLRYLLGAVVDAGRWPVDVYRGVARVFLTTIIPVALVTSGPAMALAGRLAPAFALQAIAVAAGMLVVSRWAWVQAVRRYGSAGG